MDEQIADRIERWLLSSAIQVRTGPEGGGVAGWLDACGKPVFAYPEITGYYLTCLSFMRRIGRRDERIASNAQRAVAWLHAKSRDATLRTRYYLRSDVADWRNEAEFSFDLAMVLRGLANVKGMVDEGARSEAEAAFQQRFCRFVTSTGEIAPCRALNGVNSPDRWSTRPGSFQLKTAAALLCTGSLRESGRKTIDNTFNRWRSHRSVNGDERHATMYALEGLILFGLRGCEDALKAAAALYAQCARRVTTARSDVVAQFLRAGCVLRSRGFLTPAQCAQLDPLAETLSRFSDEDGAVYYSLAEPPPLRHRNAWCAMFAYQAFMSYRGSETGSAGFVQQTAEEGLHRPRSAPPLAHELLI